MPRSDTLPSSPAATGPLVYSPVARAFHWMVAALVLITAPIGFIMVDREDHKFADSVSEAEKAAFTATTEQMFSTHKLIGMVIFGLMIARLAYRLMHGAPRSEPTLEAWQKGLSHAVHWSLYLLLLAVPIGGYIGIAMYPALDIFGMKFPNLGLAANEKLAETIFTIHGWGATLVLALVGLHLAGALFHLFVKGDGVIGRMLPGLRRK